MAANPIYIETDEEIPEVIERIRRSPAADVPLVLPNRSRLGQSRFNFQLLREYASRLDKRVAIITPDPAVQRMAKESGFAAFGGVDQYGATPERTRVEAGGPAAAEVPRPAPAAAPRVSVGAPQRLPSRVATEFRPGRLVLYSTALLVLLVGLAAIVVYVPAASVTLVADARPFASPQDVNLAAEPGRPPIRVRTVQVGKTASASFPASGVRTVPAAVAKGTFTFTNNCPPNSFGFQIPKGQRLRGGAAVQFATQDATTVAPRASTTVNIVATAAGAGGNLDSGQITGIEQNPVDCLKGSNPAPTTGGADEQKLREVAASDYEVARSTLESQLRKQIDDDLGRQLQPGEKPAPPVILPADFAADHKVGDNVASFNATVGLHGDAGLYLADDVTRAFAEALKQKVPADQSLVDTRVAVAGQAVTSSAGGRLQFKGRPSGYVAPRLDLEALKRRLVARPTNQARGDLGKLPVRSVDIREAPFQLPLMPLIGSRIDLKYVVDQGTAAPRTA